MALLPHQAYDHDEPHYETYGIRNLEKTSKVSRRVAEPRVANMLFVVEDFYCA